MPVKNKSVMLTVVLLTLICAANSYGIVGQWRLDIDDTYKDIPKKQSMVFDFKKVIQKNGTINNILVVFGCFALDFNYEIEENMASFYIARTGIQRRLCNYSENLQIIQRLQKVAFTTTIEKTLLFLSASGKIVLKLTSMQPIRKTLPSQIPGVWQAYQVQQQKQSVIIRANFTMIQLCSGLAMIDYNIPKPGILLTRFRSVQKCNNLFLTSLNRAKYLRYFGKEDDVCFYDEEGELLMKWKNLAFLDGNAPIFFIAPVYSLNAPVRLNYQTMSPEAIPQVYKFLQSISDAKLIENQFKPNSARPYHSSEIYSSTWDTPDQATNQATPTQATNQVTPTQAPTLAPTQAPLLAAQPPLQTPQNSPIILPFSDFPTIDSSLNFQSPQDSIASPSQTILTPSISQPDQATYQSLQPPPQGLLREYQNIINQIIPLTQVSVAQNTMSLPENSMSIPQNPMPVTPEITIPTSQKSSAQNIKSLIPIKLPVPQITVEQNTNLNIPDTSFEGRSRNQLNKPVETPDQTKSQEKKKYMSPITKNVVQKKWYIIGNFNPITAFIKSNRILIYGDCGVWFTTIVSGNENGQRYEVETSGPTNALATCTNKYNKYEYFLSELGYFKIVVLGEEQQMELWSKTDKLLTTWSSKSQQHGLYSQVT